MAYGAALTRAYRSVPAIYQPRNRPQFNGGVKNPPRFQRARTVPGPELGHALAAAHRALTAYKGSPAETNRKNQAFGDGPENYYRPPRPAKPAPRKQTNTGVYHGGSRPRPLRSPPVHGELNSRRKQGETTA